MTDHDADGDAELIARDDGSSDLSWGDLGHVEDDDGRDKSDSDSSNESPNLSDEELVRYQVPARERVALGYSQRWLQGLKQQTSGQ